MNRVRIHWALLLLTICCSCHQAPGQRNATTDSVYTYGDATTDGTGKYYKGREIAQVMGFDGALWLERDTRQQEENVEAAIKNLNLKPNISIADIGAGTGYYTFRIAPKVKHGKVYAVELQQDAIDYLKKRSATLNISNVAVIKGSEQSPNLPDNSIDIAIMVDVYHELTYPHEYLLALRKALKPTGKLILVEYRGEDPNVPIKALHKTTVKQLNTELAANGFSYVEDIGNLPIQHFLIYQKTDR